MSITPQYDREGMASMIRAEFKRQKEVVNGRKYKPNVRHDNTASWLAAADNCIQLGADPINFVEACFNGCRQPGGPFANQLGGPGAQCWWRMAHPRNPRDVKDEVEPQGLDLDSASLVRQELKTTFTLLIRLTKSSEPADWYDLLMNSTTTVPDYIRVTIAHWMPGINEKFGRSAMATLSKNPQVVSALKAAGFDPTPFMTSYGRHT